MEYHDGPGQRPAIECDCALDQTEIRTLPAGSKQRSCQVKMRRISQNRM